MSVPRGLKEMKIRQMAACDVAIWWLDKPTVRTGCENELVVKCVVSDGPDPVGVVPGASSHGALGSLPDVPEPNGPVVTCGCQLVLLVGVEVDGPATKKHIIKNKNFFKKNCT